MGQSFSSARCRVSSGIEGHADVVDDDAHHEDAHEEVQQDPRLHQGRHVLHQQQAEEVDAVLQHQVAHHLREGLPAGHQQQEAREQRGQRGGHQQGVLRARLEREVVGQHQAEARAQGAEHEGHRVADVGIHLALDVHLCRARRNRKGMSQPFTVTAAMASRTMWRWRPRPMARGIRPSSTPWSTANWMALLTRLVATRLKLDSMVRAMSRVEASWATPAAAGRRTRWPARRPRGTAEPWSCGTGPWSSPPGPPPPPAAPRAA